MQIYPGFIEGFHFFKHALNKILLSRRAWGFMSDDDDDDDDDEGNSLQPLG